MKKTLFNTIIALSFLAFFASSLQASEERGKKNHARADKNKDQKVSKEEWEKRTYKDWSAERKAKLWELSDADNDGFLTVKEWQDGRHAFAAYRKGKSKEGKAEKKGKAEKAEKKENSEETK
jgi:hypothetical protein